MHRTRQYTAASVLRFTLLTTIVLTLALLGSPRAARAAGVVGNGSAASCSEAALRGAVASGGRVTFNCGTSPVTIALSQELQIKAATEIDGGGKITLSGGGRTRILYVYNTTLTVRNLVLRDGASNKGGAIRAAGNAYVNVFSSRFYNNNGLTGARDAEGGGAISMHQGFLRVENSHFEGNRGTNGGAIYNMLCPATIIGSTFLNNDSTTGGVPAANWTGNWGYGGAIYTDGASLKDGVAGTLTIRNSSFIGNKAQLHGGAVYTYLYSPDNALIEGSHFENNSVRLSAGGKANGGALMHHNGPLTLRNSTFVNNRSEDAGGAIVVAQSQSGSAWNASTITNITVIGNRADAASSLKGNGGAIFVTGGLLAITSSTIAGNYADRLGGGLYSTTDNIRLRNTIVAGNRVADPTRLHHQCYRTFSGSGNVAQSPGVNETKCSADAYKADLLLSALANNGGRTKTIALLPGSPAINRGVSCPSTDQRNATRVGACDIGAFEYGGTLLSSASLTAPAMAELASDGSPVVQATWANVEGAAWYEVQVATESALADDAPAITANANSLTLVLDAGSYALRARACSEDGCGPYGAPGTVTVTQSPYKTYLVDLAN